MTGARPQTPAATWLRLLGWTVAGGLACGAAVALLAFLTARYGPSGPGWSFRGNGALAVYPLVLPALAYGWTALALTRGGHPRWPVTAGAAALVGVVLVAISAAALPLFGASPLTGPVTALGLAAAAGWTAAAPLWAVSLPGRGGAGAARTIGHIAAGAGWGLAVLAGLLATGQMVPAGS